LEYRTVKLVVWSAFIAVTLLWTIRGSISAFEDVPDGQASRQYDRVDIKSIAPERTGGHGYQLVYHVNVPIDIYWKFKTDFDNQFLIENEYIRDHRFVSKTDGTAITENRYQYGPDVFFRWRTHLFPDRYRLDFILLNPESCRQKYHFGHIQLTAEGQFTRVTQIAYFDFWGAAFWVHYPWMGGMKDFLTYTAKWEQATILRLMDHYREPANQ
jgi:hypothetical protein